MLRPNMLFLQFRRGWLPASSLIPLTIIVLLFYYHSSQSTPYLEQYSRPGSASPSCAEPAPSPAYPTALPPTLTPQEEIVRKLRDAGILVVFKTGAQEVAKLTTQIATSLRHFTDQEIIFFSDHEGFVGPFQIHDALRNVDPDIVKGNPDFILYRSIKKYQATGRNIEDLKEADTIQDNRQGWKLDKWKFIHMVEETYELRPDAKWYVFIETDTYVFWDNLVEMLGKYDPEKAIYLGFPVFIGDDEFAHGGTGYMISAAAMNRVVGPEERGLAASWDARIQDGFIYGDLAIAVALREKGIKLSPGHPYLDGHTPSTFPFGSSERWCVPIVTAHHMHSHEINNVWKFEREREKLQQKPSPITYADLYHHFVKPELTQERENWDNLSENELSAEQANAAAKVKDQSVITKRDDDETPHPQVTFETCKKACIEDKNCLQFSHNANACKLMNTFSLGEYKAPTNDGEVVWKSGWMTPRIYKWVEQNPCKTAVWPS